MIRRLIACWLLLNCAACAGPPGVSQPPVPNQDPQTLRQLQQVLQAGRGATQDQALKRFMATHEDDPWGDLARQFQQLLLQVEQLEQQFDQLTSRAESQSVQNRQLQEKLGALQTQLDELTRTLIDQATRQP